jgi:CDP-diacylglycerol--serine O-phosphatidyltransferase
MARKYGSTKRGAFFDDIADATSFGLAIGCLIFFSLSRPDSAIPHSAALAVAVLYIACLIYRLYRFLHPTRTMPKGVFQGLPSPAGALLAGSTVLLSRQFPSTASGLIAAAMVVVTSVLMISNIPYRHFGQSIWPGMPKTMKLLLFILLTMFTVFAIAHRNYRFPFLWWTFGISILYLAVGTYRKRHHPGANANHNPAENQDDPPDFDGGDDDDDGDDDGDDGDSDDGDNDGDGTSRDA